MKSKVWLNTSREEFFKLQPLFQQDLRLFMGLLSLVNIIQGTGDIIHGMNSGTLLVLFGTIIIFFTIFIQKAPKIYFPLISFLFWLTILVDGYITLRWIVNGVVVTSLGRLIIAAVWGKTVLHYERNCRQKHD